MTKTDQKKTPPQPAAPRDVFAGCVLTEMARKGEYFKYEYKGNGLPKTTVKSAPAWSPLIDGIDELLERE